MKKICTLFVAMLFVSLFTLSASAAEQIRVFISDMNAVGVENKEDLKLTLQTLLASRISSDKIASVGSANEADILVSGTYIVMGKVYSMDAVARTTSGKTVTRTYIQGDAKEELIPTVGKLADKLSADIEKSYSATASASPSVAPVIKGTAVTAAADTAVIISKPDIIKSNQVKTPASGDFIKSEELNKDAGSGWLSRRLTGAANLMAIGKSQPDGSREIFLAEERNISYYRQTNDMKLVDEQEFKGNEKIISLDTIDQGNGVEIYLTIVRGDELASQVWRVEGDKLVQVAKEIPWFFRAFSLAGGEKKLYAQPMGRDTDYYGDIFEATRSGSTIQTSNPIKMPRFGNIYTFNQFKDSDGKKNNLVISPDGYLIVFDADLKELWRSNDNFGGSELYYQKEDNTANFRISGDKYRWIFMNMRTQVSAKGDVLVAKNDGFWVLGNARLYKKGVVFCMKWNGSSLEEKWRTKDTQNYMPDYYLDESRNELLMLQTSQRAGVATRGASSLSIKKVE